MSLSTPPPAAPASVLGDTPRDQALRAWLMRTAAPHGLQPPSLRVASADASFRRYFRIDTAAGDTLIIMDAPPATEKSAAFAQVAGLMQDAGLLAPSILDWDEAGGFMLLTDLGRRTMMDLLDREQFEPNRALYGQALDVLLTWQQASRPGVLPPYDEALLRYELELFPDWYLARHRGVQLSEAMRQTLDQTFDLIIARNLAAPMVYVHRDFMPRNLMVPNHLRLPTENTQAHRPAAGPPQGRAAPSEGSEPHAAGSVGAAEPPPDRPKAASAPSGGVGAKYLGVIDFQDAVYGPVTYDIASLMRDAFVSWDEEFVLDITVRYWERARKLGFMDFEDWHRDFGNFWRAVEWMGLQRHLKVAGIFARLALRDGKPGYLPDTPRFIAYIRHTASRYRELTPLLRLVDEVEGTTPDSSWIFGRV